MASLETLPAPFLLHILMLLPDLKAHDALTRSPLVLQNVFALNAVKVFRHLLQKSVLQDVNIETRVYIVPLIRNPWQPRNESVFELLYAQARAPLPTTTSVAAIFRALRMFSYMASVGDTIIYHKLEHSRSLPHQHIDRRSTKKGILS